MKYFFLFLIPLSLVFASPVNAQVEEEDEGAVQIDSRRFIHNGKIYKQNTPYLTLGYGAGYNYDQHSVEQNMTISYHHFINKVGVAIGFHSSSDEKIWWRSYQKLNDLHLMMGKRWEGLRYNGSAFVGPSYAYGSFVGWNDTYDKEWAFGFNTVGIVAEFQYTYRIFYDLGVGLTGYVSINKFTQVAGLQLHLFFSTAYVRSHSQ